MYELYELYERTYYGLGEGLHFVSPDISHCRRAMYELYELYERACYGLGEGLHFSSPNMSH